MQITKEQAKLFLELLNVLSLPVEDNLLKQQVGRIQIGLLETYSLKKKLEEFIGEEICK